MNPSLQLLHLVRGLDRGEVRYFRAYARRTVAEGSAALALFDLILKRKTYDEDEIARIVNVSNFPALKVYLRDMIADAILEQEMKRKGVSELLALCRQIEIFQERELPQLVWLKLEKALAICSALEEFYIWRGLIEKKRRMVVLADGVSFVQMSWNC